MKTIISAMDDPALFGRVFQKGGDSWKAWRVLLATLFALPMDENGLAVFRKHTGRTTPPTQPFREAFLVVGRRGGKSQIAAAIAVFLACFRDYSGVLSPGETGTVMILGADRQQCRVIFSYIEALFSVPMLAKMVSRRTKEEIELKNRIRISVHTSSFRAVRGYTIVAALCDELAFWPSDESANPDTEVLRALRPAQLTIPNALLLGISSPYARRGELWQAYRDHFGKDNSNVLVWKATSQEMHPLLSKQFIDAELERDPAGAAAEYLAEFRSDVETFLTLDVIESCVVRGRPNCRQ